MDTNRNQEFKEVIASPKETSAFLISATSSGSGKTTLSLGLMRALTRRGDRVQPFKCGPDYIDTQFMTLAAGREAINLDLFMSSKSHVRELFNHYNASADISIVEGVMGLFDGYDGMEGSCASIAMTIGIPVVLLIDAASSAYSLAAVIFGFTRFNPRVKVAGVIFNRVASDNHYSLLKKACVDVGVECFGYMKKHPRLTTPSRHLGLTLKSSREMNEFIDFAADEVVSHVDMDRLLAATRSVRVNDFGVALPNIYDLHIAVAKDEAFNFIYPANLRVFRNITFFSPLTDSHLPPADLVYFPGGYPELFASKLEKNSGMRESVSAFADDNGRILGECGGLIYLCRAIDGHAMCNVFPFDATMDNCSLTLGYRSLQFHGLLVKGHEFHYSHLSNPDEIGSIAIQYNAKGMKVDTPVYRYKNTIAGYTHLYWGETDILKLWDK